MENIKLAKQEVAVEKCRECDHLMVNLDADQLAPGDLVTLKHAGIRISNPDTDKAVCLNCEYKTFGRQVADFFESDKSDDDDDSSFFSSDGGFGSFGGYSHSSPTPSFGGFGGFGGGSFSGGGASRGF